MLLDGVAGYVADAAGASVSLALTTLYEIAHDTDIDSVAFNDDNLRSTTSRWSCSCLQQCHCR